MSWFKKTITAQEMGAALWKACCEFTMDFCERMETKLVGKIDEDQGTKFVQEAMVLHFWIIWQALGSDRASLDAMATGLSEYDVLKTGGYVGRILKSRMQAYDDAWSEDMKGMGGKFSHPVKLPEAFFRFAMPNALPGFFVMTETFFITDASRQAIMNFRAKFNVR